MDGTTFYSDVLGGAVKVIYVAGKYRDTRGEWYVMQNIRDAERVALQIWKLGGVALCPHMNTRFFGGTLPDETWLSGDLELLRRCDALFLMSNAANSTGAQEEAKLAKTLGLPVLEGIVQLRHYLLPGGSG